MWDFSLGIFFLPFKAQVPKEAQWLLEILTLSGFYIYMEKLGNMSPKCLKSVKLVEGVEIVGINKGLWFV